MTERQDKLRAGVLFHQNYATFLKASIAIAAIRDAGFESSEHPYVR